jgi:hypothetical protein
MQQQQNELSAITPQSLTQQQQKTPQHKTLSRNLGSRLEHAKLRIMASLKYLCNIIVDANTAPYICAERLLT